MTNKTDIKYAEFANEFIAHSSNRDKQALKKVEEVGELCRAILKQDDLKITEGIGDIIATIAILAHQYDYDVNYCLDTAWDVIKDRAG